MSFWQIVVPAGAQNLVNNPTPRLSSANYSAIAGAAGRDATKTRRGINCIKVTPAAGVNDGLYYSSVPLVNGTTYYFSLDFWGALGVPYRIYFATAGGAVKGTPATVTGTGYWNPARLECSFTADASANFRLYVVKNNNASVTDFWIDGVMVTTVPSSTYIDGAQPGCSWDGSAWTSTSTRSAQSRDGGRVVDFDTYDLAVEEWNGVGMADINNILLSYGLQDGAFFQRQKANPRTFTLSSTINANLPGATPNDLAALFTNRKAFIDAIKPDAADPQQPFWLRCSAPAKPMWIRALYQDGAKMRYNQGFVEQPQPILVCPDPYWYEDGNCAAVLNGTATIAAANYALKVDTDEVLSTLSTGFNADTYCVCACSDGTVLFGGNFTTAGGVAAVRIARWNPATSTFTALGSGCNGIVYAIIEAPDGTIYVGGEFSAAGGVANTAGIAKYTPSTSTWSAVGTGGGVGSRVSALVFGLDGKLYVGGNFPSMGGVANTIDIASWSGSAWAALGTGVTAGSDVEDLACGLDGSIYACGLFTGMGGVADTAYMAKWSGSAWSSVGVFNGEVYTLAVDNIGYVYARGPFTTINGASALRIACYNGVAWSQLGPGIASFGYSKMFYDKQNSILYFGGTPIGYPAAAIYKYNGSFSPVSFTSPGLRDMAKLKNSLYLCITFGGATGQAQVAITNNGSASSFPVITITGAGAVTKIRNGTNGKQIVFNNLTLLAGEVMTIDLTPGNTAISSNFRADMLGYVVPGSNLATFRLVPGANVFTVYTGTGNNSVVIQWRNRYWSIDGGAN